MPEGRGPRFALEAGFLIAVAVLIGIADPGPLWIVLVMLLAWVIVAMLEWTSWRMEPHYASGSPPRYYVPPVPLPGRRAVEPVAGYPTPAAESPTWIAPPEMRDELLAGWPVPDPEAEPELESEEPVEDTVEELAEPETVKPDLEEKLLDEAAAAAPEPEPEDTWVVEELPPAPAVSASPPASPPVRHRLDPLKPPPPRRRPWQRSAPEETGVIVLPELPSHVRVLPPRSAAKKGG